MSISTEAALSLRAVAPLAPWGTLPPRIRVLYVTTERHPVESLGELLAADSAMCIELEMARQATPGLARLREANYDAVLVRHDPPELDALDFAEALRGGGGEDPLVIVGDHQQSALAPLCHEVGADAYVSLVDFSPRYLIWTLARAIEWHRLVQENRRLAQLERQRLRLEHNGAERLLREQRDLIRDLEDLTDSAPALSSGAPPIVGAPAGPPIADDLMSEYRDLLRAYVIMGSGTLTAEIGRLAARIVANRLPPARVMQLHVHVLEGVLRGLGTRGVRHVMSRADLLILDLMIHLAEQNTPADRDGLEGHPTVPSP